MISHADEIWEHLRSNIIAIIRNKDYSCSKENMLYDWYPWKLHRPSKRNKHFGRQPYFHHQFPLHISRHKTCVTAKDIIRGRNKIAFALTGKQHRIYLKPRTYWYLAYAIPLQFYIIFTKRKQQQHTHKEHFWQRILFCYVWSNNYLVLAVPSWKNTVSSCGLYF